MQAETRFKEKVIKELKKIPLTWFVKIQMVATRGIPDLLICCNGVFVAWELKVKDNKADPLQAHVIEKIREASGLAYVVTPENLEDALDHLSRLAGDSPWSRISQDALKNG